MGTLLVGLLVVTAGAVGFGLALFGRRPVPQTATEAAPPHHATTPARALPGSALRDAVAGMLPSATRPRNLQRGAGAVDSDRVVGSGGAVVTGWVRLRAALLLALTVVGLAALIGAALSIAVVSLVLVAT